MATWDTNRTNLKLISIGELMMNEQFFSLFKDILKYKLSEQDEQQQQAQPQQAQQQQGQDEEQQIAVPVPLELGKALTLKKIYSYLMTISDILDHFNEDEYDKLKTMVHDAIDIFYNIILNFSQFKDKIEDIIVKYETFIADVLVKLEKMKPTTVENVYIILNKNKKIVRSE